MAWEDWFMCLETGHIWCSCIIIIKKIVRHNFLGKTLQLSFLGLLLTTETAPLLLISFAKDPKELEWDNKRRETGRKERQFEDAALS